MAPTPVFVLADRVSETPPPRRPSRLVAFARWTLAWGFRLLTRPGRRALAHVCTWIWFDVVRFRRRLILANLALAFPDWSEPQRRAVGRKSLWHLCYSAAEAFLLPFLHRDNLAADVTFHGTEVRDHARARGKGVLLLVVHLGNVEKLMAACALGGMTAQAIAKRFKNRFFDELVYGTRQSFGLRFIDPHSDRTAFEILHALKRKEYVAFVLDQFTKKAYGVETTFFGRTVTTAYGLALFALKSRAPVVPAYCHRDDTGHLHVCFGPEVPPVDAPDRDEAVQATTQRYSDTMESLIRQHADQWMWVHNRWKPLR